MRQSLDLETALKVILDHITDPFEEPGQAQQGHACMSRWIQIVQLAFNRHLMAQVSLP